eukprot:1055342-Prymnesium_polylepis.2
MLTSGQQHPNRCCAVAAALPKATPSVNLPVEETFASEGATSSSTALRKKSATSAAGWHAAGQRSVKHGHT